VYDDGCLWSAVFGTRGLNVGTGGCRLVEDGGYARGVDPLLFAGVSEVVKDAGLSRLRGGNGMAGRVCVPQELSTCRS